MNLPADQSQETNEQNSSITAVDYSQVKRSKLRELW